MTAVGSPMDELLGRHVADKYERARRASLCDFALLRTQASLRLELLEILSPFATLDQDVDIALGLAEVEHFESLMTKAARQLEFHTSIPAERWLSAARAWAFRETAAPLREMIF